MLALITPNYKLKYQPQYLGTVRQQKNKDAKFKVLCGIHASFILRLILQRYVTMHSILLSDTKKRK